MTLKMDYTLEEVEDRRTKFLSIDRVDQKIQEAKEEGKKKQICIHFSCGFLRDTICIHFAFTLGCTSESCHSCFLLC